MTYAEKLRVSLLAARNPDGGWPLRQGYPQGHSQGSSWTEPTALALLALRAANDSTEAPSQGAAWLAKLQSSDGGWPPCATVPTSTWVSSLALLALAHESAHSRGCLKGVEWLSRQVSPELTALQEFVQHTLGISPPRAPGSMPWFPGTSGWVAPTAFSMLAFYCWSNQLPNARLAALAERGQDYLLSHRCADGGWNHGGSLQRSEASPSYAETTGLALLALAKCRSAALAPSLRLAEAFLRQPDSPEGSAWLLMGLAAHGQPVDPLVCLNVRLRTTRDIALRLIALHALRGQNPFLQSAV
jgi:hypothetical protein